MVIKKLKSLKVNMKNGVAKVEVNGENISPNGSYLNLTFENGEWSLMVSKDEVYSISDQNLRYKFRYKISDFFKTIFKTVFHIDDKVVQ